MAKRNRKRGSTRQQRELIRKKRRRKRVLLLTTELVILAVLGVVAFGVFKLNKLDFKNLNTKNLAVYKDTGPYTNVALFGLDSREGEIEGGVQSDCIMIASINNKTNDVKIVSVYRDMLSQQSDGSYEKANSAYNMGGPEEAIALLNRNLDLDIKKYISVNFNALVSVIDALGGIEVNIETEEEVNQVTSYASEIIDITGKDTEGLERTGLQTLNGTQATAYARIRYTEGNDFKRTERQRLVLEKIVQKAQKANLITLNRIIDEVLPQVSTNFTTKEMMGIAANGMKYKIGKTSGFPFELADTDVVQDHEGSYVVPLNYADNVSKLHKFLFGKEEYEPSDKVWEINNDINYLTGQDVDNQDTYTDETYTDETSVENSENYIAE
ncbi:MAG: LCP family protein [Lachnospiraceae bacterium]